MSFEPVSDPYNASDPSANFLSSSALDFLLIELVPLAYRVTNTTSASSSSNGDILNSNQSTATSPPAVTSPADNASTGANMAALAHNPGAAPSATGATTTAGGAGADEDETSDAVHHRLEAAGYRVGQGLVERFSRDRPRFNDTLDVIKFLCKDLWSLVFGKNIDNLKTNHRGVFVLTDNVFRPFSRMSTEAGGQAVVRAQPFLWFPCGIVRGALATLGIDASVQAEINDLPGAVFQIKTNPTNS